MSENTGLHATNPNAMGDIQKCFTGPGNNLVESMHTVNISRKPNAVPESKQTASNPSPLDGNPGNAVYVKDPNSKRFVKISMEKKTDGVPGSKPIIVCSKLDAKSGHAIKPQSDYVIIAGKSTNTHGAKPADNLSLTPHVIQTPTGKIKVRRLGHGINIPGHQTTWESVWPNQKEANALKENAPHNNKIIAPLLQTSECRIIETPAEHQGQFDSDNKFKLLSECNKNQNVDMQSSPISPAENKTLHIPTDVYPEQSKTTAPTEFTPERNLFDSFSIWSQNDKVKEHQAHVNPDDRNVPTNQNVKIDAQNNFSGPDMDKLLDDPDVSLGESERDQSVHTHDFSSFTSENANRLNSFNLTSPNSNSAERLHVRNPVLFNDIMGVTSLSPAKSTWALGGDMISCFPDSDCKKTVSVENPASQGSIIVNDKDDCARQ